MSAQKFKEIDIRNQEVAKEIIKLVNIMGNDEELAKVIIEELSKTHRTLIQSYFRCVKGVIEGYADTFTSDLRNEASLKWAQEVKDGTGHH